MDLGRAVHVCECVIVHNGACLACVAIGVWLVTLFFAVSPLVAVHALYEILALPSIVTFALAPSAVFFAIAFLLCPSIREVVEGVIPQHAGHLLGISEVVEDAWFDASIGIGRGKVAETFTDFLAYL